MRPQAYLVKQLSDGEHLVGIECDGHLYVMTLIEAEALLYDLHTSVDTLRGLRKRPKGFLGRLRDALTASAARA